MQILHSLVHSAAIIIGPGQVANLIKSKPNVVACKPGYHGVFDCKFNSYVIAPSLAKHSFSLQLKTMSSIASWHDEVSDVLAMKLVGDLVFLQRMPHFRI